MRTLKQPRALVTRDSIIAAAGRLFAIKGYHGTKLEDILAAAEVTTGAFFHHFHSKEDLGFAVLDRHMEKRRQLLETIEAAMPAAYGDPLEEVFRRLDAIREMARRRERGKGGCVIGNLSTALSDTHEAFRRRLAKCFDQMAGEFKPHLDAAARHGGKIDKIDTWEMARYIVAIVEGSIMLTRTHRDRQMMERQFELLKQHLRQTLGK
jgi:TetR/AcrR family transcriptional repressor of nem operon